MAKDELNVPSLVVVLVVSGFLIRHFFFRGSGSSSTDASSRASSTGNSREQRNAEALNRRFEDAVARIQQIFPYVDRRDVWWELRRNGLNINAATERILSGGLDNPPPLPVQAAPAAASGNNTGTAAAAGPASAKSSQPSLIQRYRLENQVKETDAQGDSAPASLAAGSPGSPGSAAGSKTKSWSSNRDERQALLKKRRDDMILEARRKMEAKLAAEKAAGGV